MCYNVGSTLKASEGETVSRSRIAGLMVLFVVLVAFMLGGCSGRRTFVYEATTESASIVRFSGLSNVRMDPCAYRCSKKV